MRVIYNDLVAYVRQLSRALFWGTALFVAVAIFINYYFDLNGALRELPVAGALLGWTAVFLTAFSFPYILSAIISGKAYFTSRNFRILLLLAPALFALKMAAPFQLQLVEKGAENAYWSAVCYYPFKLIVMLAGLWLIWRWQDRDQPFYGTSRKQFSMKPYAGMLLVMLPLIALASTQPDFLGMYPKAQHFLFLKGEGKGLYQLLYELSYGTDFISIEIFFRGFLILGFVKWAGKDAILPMAAFYCTIHFGKPLGECISSFFGGIILGVVTLHTRSVWGGLMVHLGIAWLMEAGGYIGNSWL